MNLSIMVLVPFVFAACGETLHPPVWQPKGELNGVVLYLPPRDTNGNVLDHAFVGALAHAMKEAGATVTSNQGEPHHATLFATLDKGVCEHTAGVILLAGSGNQCEKWLAASNERLRERGTPPLSAYANIRSAGLSYAFVHAYAPPALLRGMRETTSPQKPSSAAFVMPSTGFGSARPLDAPKVIPLTSEEQAAPFVFVARVLASRLLSQHDLPSVQTLPLHAGEDL